MTCAREDQQIAGQRLASLKYDSKPRINEKTGSSWTTGKWNRQIPWFQKSRKQVRLIVGCVCRDRLGDGGHLGPLCVGDSRHSHTA